MRAAPPRPAAAANHAPRNCPDDAPPKSHGIDDLIDCIALSSALHLHHHLAAMASLFHAFPLLRSAAPRLSRRIVECTPCLHAPMRSALATARSSAPRPTLSQSVRWKSTQPLRSSAALTAPQAEGATLAGAANGQARSSSSFPKTSSRTVAYWLLGSAASVFGIVVFGGLTRLTESG
jgi:cytochrome c oxidase assembly protein subunit 15